MYANILLTTIAEYTSKISINRTRHSSSGSVVRSTNKPPQVELGPIRAGARASRRKMSPYEGTILALTARCLIFSGRFSSPHVPLNHKRRNPWFLASKIEKRSTIDPLSPKERRSSLAFLFRRCSPVLRPGILSCALNSPANVRISS